jgi:fused signal recognition particle receptor
MGILDIFSSKKEANAEAKPSFLSKIAKIIVGKSYIDDDLLDEIEEMLITSDVDVDTAVMLIKRLQNRVAQDKYNKADQVIALLKEEILKILPDTVTEQQYISQLTTPYILLVVGVNGVGKTTTIGKLANLFIKNGKKVVLGAADTFRAGAAQQLKLWGDKVGAEVFAGKDTGSDPASVAYETVNHLIEKNLDIAIIDTAGRLHNKIGLMNELSKIKKVIKKRLPTAPDEVLLVLDSSMGQNTFLQVKIFLEATEVNSLAITKLDGTAKGGSILGLYNMFNIPIKFAGVGEGLNDLTFFDKHNFVETLFKS